jgi:uncharacterized repeat protein (TIGR03803 family)
LTVLHAFDGTDGAIPYARLLRDNAGNLYGTTYRGGTSNFGVVFKVDPAGKYSVLHNFGPIPDGQDPFDGLVEDQSGNLYGTTCCGGTGGRGDGTLFEISNSGQETVLYSFQGTPDGEFPHGPIRDSAGNLYGTTYQGGTAGWGTVYELDSAGKETVLYSFQGTPDGADPYAETLVRDSAGNLYGTNYYDAEFGWGTIFEIDPSGNETILYNFPGSPGAYLAYSGLTTDPEGNFYGVTEGGGTQCYPYGCGVVYEYSKAGDFTILYDFSGSPDGKEPFGQLIRDKAGNLYGTTIEGGASDHGTVFKVDKTGKETVLHSFKGKSEGKEPFAGLIMDEKGNLYGTTRHGGAHNKGVVFKLTP